MSRKNISQPPEWWLAFQAEADKHGQSLSEWMGDCCRSNLPKSVRLAARTFASAGCNRWLNFVTRMREAMGKSVSDEPR